VNSQPSCINPALLQPALAVDGQHPSPYTQRL